MKNQEQKTILLVEDDTTTLMVETHQLQSFGYDVVSAKSGEEAVQIVTGNDQIALVLMDIELSSGMDGAEAARQILGKRHLPIVFLTVHTDKEYVGRIKGIAGYGCVIKNSGDVVLHSSIEMAFNLFKSQEVLKDQFAQLNNLKDIINRSGSLVFIWRMEPGKWPVEFVSENVADILGYSVEDFISGRVEWPAITHPDDVPRLEKEVAGYLEKGERKWSQEYRLITKSGEVRWVHDDNLALEDSDGKIIRIQAVIHDITERKKAEEALRKSEEHYRVLLEASFEFIYVIGRDDTIQYANPVALKALGRSAVEVNGKPRTSFFPPSTAATQKLSLDRVFATGEPLFVEQKIDMAGSVQWQDTQLIPLKSSGGSVDAVLGISRDITERKKAEEALRLFKDLVEHSSDAIGMSTPDGRHYYQNEAFNRLFGDIGDCPPETVYVDQAVGKQVFDTIMGGGSWQGEIKMFKKDRTILDIFQRAYAIRNKDGRIIGLVGLHTDITERKRAEKALRESEEKYSSYVENAPDGVFIVDEKGHYLEVNKAACLITGFTKEELLQMSIRDLLPKESLEAGIAHFKTVSKTGAAKGEFQFKHKDGSKRWWSVDAAKITETLFLGFAKDITKRKQVESVLRESEDKFKSVFENASIGILLADLETKKYFTCNNEMCRMVGYSLEEIQKMGVMGLHPEKDIPYVLAQFEKQTKGKTSPSNDIPVKRKDGSVFYADINSSYITIAGKKYLAGFFTDITERKEMQEHILASEKLAVMGRLVADVAHEINNPLSIIMSGTQHLEERVKKQTPANPDLEANARMFERVKNAANRCKIIVAGLLTSTRPTRLDLRATAINKVIKESLASTKDRVKRQKIKVVKDFAPRLPIIESDGQRLNQVFINIITNACDAMPEGGELRIATRLQTLACPPVPERRPGSSAREAGGKGKATESPAIEIEISDTGEGIRKEDLPKLFDPFFTTKKDGKGVGLGLSISYGIVREHGGSISVTSEKGKGATFIVSLPYRT